MDQTLRISEARLRRALEQRIYVIDVQPQDSAVELKIQGASDTEYTINVDATHYSCNCPDFQQRGAVIGYCKHILNVMVKVLKVPLSPGTSFNICLALDRLKSLRRSKQAESETLADSDDDCSICFERLSPPTSACWQCRKHHHLGCLRIWFKSKRNCPLCRAVLPPVLEPQWGV